MRKKVVVDDRTAIHSVYSSEKHKWSKAGKMIRIKVKPTKNGEIIKVDPRKYEPTEKLTQIIFADRG
jgi:hypothetical protein